jgi:predicted amidohydrolase YtcJ
MPTRIVGLVVILAALANLIAHTRSNAYLFLQENALGSLEVGKQADLVVLDRDYMTVPAAQIKNIGRR